MKYFLMSDALQCFSENDLYVLLCAWAVKKAGRLRAFTAVAAPPGAFCPPPSPGGAIYDGPVATRKKGPPKKPRQAWTKPTRKALYSAMKHYKARALALKKLKGKTSYWFLVRAHAGLTNRCVPGRRGVHVARRVDDSPHLPFPPQPPHPPPTITHREIDTICAHVALNRAFYAAVHVKQSYFKYLPAHTDSM